MKNFRSSPIQLGENIFTGPDGISKDIQVLRVGNFFHNGQQIEITKSHLKTMIKNFHEGVRGVDLMLDYGHNSDANAAAWFEDVYLSDDGKELWAKVDWTEGGADSVRKKEYRYISADFNFAYKDNESLKDYGPTLLGAGLTNRPVVKKMNPTILSENNNPSEEEMPQDNKDEMEKLRKENKELKEKLAEKDKDESMSEIKKREDAIAEREKAVKLAEEKAETEKKEAAKKVEFDTMLSEAKVVEAQRESFMKDDMAEFVKNAGSVNLAEKGNGATGKKDVEFADSETPAQDEVISLAEKKIKDEQVTIDQGIDMVLSENAELRKKYEAEVNE